MSLITTRRLVLGFILILNAGFCFAQKKEEKKYPALLWQITGNGLTKPSYLFGTMHVSSKMVFNLGDSFYSGIKNSDVVALELDPQLWQDQMSRFQVMQNNLRLYTQGSPNDYLNEKSFQIENYEDKLKAALSEEPTIINGLLYRTFQQRADFEEDTYLDLYIYQTGKKLGKQATGVENYFETEKLIVEATQDMMKDKNRRNHDGDGESVYELERKTEEAYRQGDLDLLDSLERIMQPSDAYMEKFLYRRNEIQANSIDSILKKHSLFVGVGAAHLPGKRGVIELLRQKGYNLRPISIQARDASERDEIDKIKVPVKFSYLTSDDGSFSVKLPGKFYKRADSRYNDDSWQYADMSNGSYYMVTSVKTYNQFVGQNSDLVFKKIDSLLYENIPGKILKKNIIERNGYKGFDITNKTRRGDIQRYNIIVTPFEVLVFKMSGVGNYVDGDEANIFFGSITLKRNNVENWANYEPSAGGFKIKLPQQPFVTKNTSGFDGIRWEYESNDSINGDAYLILRKSLNNYRFLDEDSFQLSMMAESFRLSDYIDKNVETKYTIRNNQPVIESKYKLKDGSYIRARYFIKGPNYYVLAAHSKIDKTFPEFFNSFSFQSFYYPEFTDYIDSITSFKVSTPVIPDIDTDMRNIYERATSEEFLNSVSEHNGYWPRNKTALFRDDSTGEAVYVSVERFPKYYFPKDSASFWKDEANEKRIKENFIIHSKERFRLNDSAIGYKYIFSDTGSSRFICNWMFLKNNRLYRVISLNDSLQQSDFVKHFYASINPLEKQNDASVFSDKLDLFFHDFYSKDSATNQKAKAAIQNVYFGAHGADRLLHAIQSLPYNNKDYFETKAKLIDELGYINDSSVINHIVEGLKKIYERADDTSMIQNAVFRALAKNKTKESYHLLKTLLLQDPPVFDNSSDYNYFLPML